MCVCVLDQISFRGRFRTEQDCGISPHMQPQWAAHLLEPCTSYLDLHAGLQGRPFPVEITSSQTHTDRQALLSFSVFILLFLFALKVFPIQSIFALKIFRIQEQVSENFSQNISE